MPPGLLALLCDTTDQYVENAARNCRERRQARESVDFPAKSFVPPGVDVPGKASDPAERSMNNHLSVLSVLSVSSVAHFFSSKSHGTHGKIQLENAGHTSVQ